MTNVRSSFAPMMSPRRLGAVCLIGRDVELHAFAGLDADESALPAWNHAAGSEDDGERLATVVAVVELDAVGAAHTDVVDDDRVAHLGFGARALLEHRDLELGGDRGRDLDSRLVGAGRRGGRIGARRIGPFGRVRRRRVCRRLGRIARRITCSIAATGGERERTDDHDASDQSRVPHTGHSPTHRSDATGHSDAHHVARSGVLPAPYQRARTPRRLLPGEYGLDGA